MSSHHLPIIIMIIIPSFIPLNFNHHHDVPSFSLDGTRFRAASQREEPTLTTASAQVLAMGIARGAGRAQCRPKNHQLGKMVVSMGTIVVLMGKLWF